MPREFSLEEYILDKITIPLYSATNVKVGSVIANIGHTDKIKLTTMKQIATYFRNDVMEALGGYDPAQPFTYVTGRDWDGCILQYLTNYNHGQGVVEIIVLFEMLGWGPNGSSVQYIGAPAGKYIVAPVSNAVPNVAISSYGPPTFTTYSSPT